MNNQRLRKSTHVQIDQPPKTGLYPEKDKYITATTEATLILLAGFTIVICALSTTGNLFIIVGGIVFITLFITLCFIMLGFRLRFSWPYKPDRLNIRTIGDQPLTSAKKKEKHGIDVTLADDHIYRIRGVGRKLGGRVQLDLAGVYSLRYWLAADTTLTLRLYNLHNQHEQDLATDATGTDTRTIYLDDSRYEVTITIKTARQYGDDWLIELEPLYDHGLDET